MYKINKENNTIELKGIGTTVSNGLNANSDVNKEELKLSILKASALLKSISYCTESMHFLHCSCMLHAVLASKYKIPSLAGAMDSFILAFSIKLT